MNVIPQKPKNLWGSWLLSLVVGMVLIAVVSAIHRNSPRTLVSFHGLLHAPIANGYAEGTRSTYPPENPFYAGEPLYYYWFFHALAGQLVRVFDMNVFHAFEAVTFAAIIGMVAAAVVLGQRLFNNTLTGCTIVFLIVAGTNPLGFIFAIIKIIQRGGESLQDDPGYLWGVVHPLFGLIRFNDMGGVYGPMINFFLNITSRPAALSALLISILSLHGTLTNRGWLSVVFLCVSIALTTAFSPVIGLSAVFALALGISIVFLLPIKLQLGSHEKAYVPMRRLVVVIVAMIVGAFVAMPTYYHLLFNSSFNHSPISILWILSASGVQHALMVFMSILPLVVLAYLGWQQSPLLHRTYLLMLLLAGLVLLGICVTVSLPDGNSCNFFNASVILFAVPASAFILRIGEIGQQPTVSLRKLVFVGALFLPTTLILLTSYVQRPDVDVTFSKSHISRVPTDSDLAKLYDWVREQTPSDAIFVLNTTAPFISVCGNTPEFPAMTGRVVFTLGLKHYLVKPYPQAALRVKIADKLSSGEPIAADELQYMSDLQRSIYLVVFDEDKAEVSTHRRSQNGKPVFNISNIAVYRIRLTL